MAPGCTDTRGRGLTLTSESQHDSGDSRRDLRRGASDAEQGIDQLNRLSMHETGS